ncbi:hypothetical protein ACQKQA_17995 [Pseudomonas sp. NPDC089530]|uniref:hypothetical protein n=1 Tax=Pseudomonas sp. NPDC089530 TaxID=3390651 RepID=UPI003CFCAF58
MSNSMGIASAFVLSSLFLAPMAMAEESQTFAAHNAARAAAFQEAREALAAKQQHSEQPQEVTAQQRQAEVQKDS